MGERRRTGRVWWWLTAGLVAGAAVPAVVAWRAGGARSEVVEPARWPSGVPGGPSTTTPVPTTAQIRCRTPCPPPVDYSTAPPKIDPLLEQQVAAANGGDVQASLLMRHGWTTADLVTPLHRLYPGVYGIAEAYVNQGELDELRHEPHVAGVDAEHIIPVGVNEAVQLVTPAH